MVEMACQLLQWRFNARGASLVNRSGAPTFTSTIYDTPGSRSLPQQAQRQQNSCAEQATPHPMPPFDTSTQRLKGTPYLLQNWINCKTKPESNKSLNGLES
jgi:hypothetical protein